MTGKPFPEQTVLVTGASRGIGAAVAERFAQAGLRVVVHYREGHEAANEVARRCAAHGAQVLTAQADVASREQLLAMKERLDRYGFPPDIVVNSAGIAHYGMVADLSEADWDRVMAVNAKGTFLVAQTFMEAMVRNKYGRIINISSVWGNAGASCEAVYSASKGAVHAFTKALAKELAPSGITVNAVAPGAVATEMMAGFDEQERRAIAEEIPAGRFAEPSEVASLVYFLALPESGYLTGQIISPNGGWLT
ncbi:3-ketoacyl-ACP reductase [Paenibacillus sp. J31TS4]|uniref:elongation factor P 5-aminopentanone reductase n=1 Tax=Paenibacillus sp. J31TS4 TaxID=2807195 RepID=UPI001B145422|nr:3-oxoacyl-ACP reductase FabG [Paenibacillus sp. J31TS4]GIP36879.1 3-ketoacyl-ACP reductase [Paenibacillus sp. J31TS4]